MDKIAVLLGSNNETISFDEEGMIKVFFKQNKGWSIVQEVPLILGAEKGLSGIREKITQAANTIKDCNIIVGKKVYGIAYNVFETLQFNIWETEGEPHTFLDDIFKQEERYRKEEMKKEIKKEIIASEESLRGITYMNAIAEGHYEINLTQIQSENGTISSKQLLIPFLKKENFKKLDILCTHIPPWIENEIKKYQLQMEVVQLDVNNYTIRLLHM
jgi:Fe-only nitrogenase accessory protein AnfO